MLFSFLHLYSSFSGRIWLSGSYHAHRASPLVRPHAQRHLRDRRSSHPHTVVSVGRTSRSTIQLTSMRICMSLERPSCPRFNSFLRKMKCLSTMSSCASVVKLQSRRRWKGPGKPTRTMRGSKMSFCLSQEDRRQPLAAGELPLWTASIHSGSWISRTNSTKLS